MSKLVNALTAEQAQAVFWLLVILLVLDVIAIYLYTQRHFTQRHFKSLPAVAVVDDVPQYKKEELLEELKTVVVALFECGYGIPAMIRVILEAAMEKDSEETAEGGKP